MSRDGHVRAAGVSEEGDIITARGRKSGKHPVDRWISAGGNGGREGSVTSKGEERQGSRGRGRKVEANAPGGREAEACRPRPTRPFLSKRLKPNILQLDYNILL